MLWRWTSGKLSSKAALNQICDHTMLRFRVLFSSYTQASQKVKNDLVNSSEKMQQFWQAVSLAKIGGEKKRWQCMLGSRAHAGKKSPSIACFATPRRRERGQKLFQLAVAACFAVKSFSILKYLVHVYLLAPWGYSIHSLPWNLYSWINDVSSFLKRGLFDAFFSQKKLWLMAIFSLLFPSFDFTTFPPPICISCSVSHSFSSSVAELCINAVWIRVMSLARGLANYWSPMLLYHQ